MKVERVVLDTNVLISALLSHNGTPRKLLNRLARQTATLLFSDATFAELVTRLAKRKFDRYRTGEQMEAYLDSLSELGEWVYVLENPAVCRDPDDDILLATAASGEADLLVTGDQDLLVLNPFEGLPILSPADCLERIDPQ
jgi:putative PIN family toxin of toxin-antitoxin system